MTTDRHPPPTRPRGARHPIIVALLASAVLVVAGGSRPASAVSSTPMVAQSVKLRSGTAVLSVPRGWTVSVAAAGLPPRAVPHPDADGRIIATTLYNLADNTRGTLEILDGFDERSGRFTKVTRYLGGLRNPNSVAFLEDGRPRGSTSR